MRGKQDDTFIATAVDRNIPAYAGKTLFVSGTEEGDREHPRVCGENAT